MISLVCGFGRCGSSLVMQMLYAGGYPVIGDWPSFEDERQTRLTAVADRWIGEWDGKFGKWLEPITYPLPKQDIPYRVLWLKRDHGQQARSFCKIQREVLGLGVKRQDIGRLRKQFNRNEPKAIAKLKQAAGDVFSLRFESMLRDPYENALRLCVWASEGHPPDESRARKMAEVVRARNSDCLRTILERDVLTDGPPQVKIAP